MPITGFGTYMLRDGTETINSVKHALKLGVRLIDTAAYYQNEVSVGKAVKESGLRRDKFFICTKLWNDDQKNNQQEKAFHESLEKLDVDYIDLYLIHWPVTGVRMESWKILEGLYEQGLIKSIGVSNYTIKHLKELLDDCKIKPIVNQVEFSPYLNQKELYEFCLENEIQLMAYASLTRGKKFNDKKLIDIAKNYGKTPAQTLLRWAIQKQIVIIPKSAKNERINENYDIFEFRLTEEDMVEMGEWDIGFRTTFDPKEIP